MKHFLIISLSLNMFSIYCVSQQVQDLLKKQPHRLTLYAPWRNRYDHNRKEGIIQKKKCPFCTQIQKEQDEKNFILYRSQHAIVILNLYPYSKGHLLIVPYKHVGILEQLTIEERIDLIELTSFTASLLQKELHAIGVNIGINIGQNSGASLPDHLHIHVLPRFKSDRGFINLISQTEVVSWDLHCLYATLKPCFNTLIIN